MTEEFGLGHNSGTPAEMVRIELGEKLREFDKRKAEVLGGISRAVITDNDTMAKGVSLIGMIRALRAAIDQRADEVMAPHIQAKDAVRVARDKWLSEIDAGEVKLLADIEATRAEQRRKATEQQLEQQALEEAKAPAIVTADEIDTYAGSPPPSLMKKRKPATFAPHPVQPIKLAPVVGDYGGRVGDRATKTFSWADVRKVDLQVFNHPKVKEAMQQACRSLSQAGVTLKGVTVDGALKSTVRK